MESYLRVQKVPLGLLWWMPIFARKNLAIQSDHLVCCALQSTVQGLSGRGHFHTNPMPVAEKLDVQYQHCPSRERRFRGASLRKARLHRSPSTGRRLLVMLAITRRALFATTRPLARRAALIVIDNALSACCARRPGLMKRVVTHHRQVNARAGMCRMVSRIATAAMIPEARVSPPTTPIAHSKPKMSAIVPARSAPMA